MSLFLRIIDKENKPLLLSNQTVPREPSLWPVWVHCTSTSIAARIACRDVIVLTIILAVVAWLVVDGTIGQCQRQKSSLGTAIIQRDTTFVSGNWNWKWRDQNHLNQEVQQPCDANISSAIYQGPNFKLIVIGCRSKHLPYYCRESNHTHLGKPNHFCDIIHEQRLGKTVINVEITIQLHGHIKRELKRCTRCWSRA